MIDVPRSLDDCNSCAIVKLSDLSRAKYWQTEWLRCDFDESRSRYSPCVASCNQHWGLGSPALCIIEEKKKLAVESTLFRARHGTASHGEYLSSPSPSANNRPNCRLRRAISRSSRCRSRRASANNHAGQCQPGGELALEWNEQTGGAILYFVSASI